MDQDQRNQLQLLPLPELASHAQPGGERELGRTGNTDVSREYVRVWLQDQTHRKGRNGRTAPALPKHEELKRDEGGAGV